MEAIIKKIYRIFVFLILLWPLILAGQTDSLSTYKRSLPVMNDHYFIPNSNFPAPFITTFFKTSIGGGISLNTIPIYTNDGESLLGTIEGEDTYVTADIHVQVEAKDWLAVWFRYQANVRIGSSTPALFAHGVTSKTGFDFGWMLRLWHNKKNQLSGTINIKNTSVSAINISGYLRDIIDNRDSINTAPYQEENPLDGGAGFRYAYSFNNMIGIQAFINASYGESVLKDNRNVWRFNMGLLGSINFIHSHDIPIGFNLGYMFQRFAPFESQNEDKKNSFLFKAAYAGREEYNIGLEFTYYSTAAQVLDGIKTPNYLATSFVLVYYF